jgi:mono/diheme cytochrome c family protein
MPRMLTAAVCGALCASFILVGALLAKGPAVPTATGQPLRLDWIRKELMTAHYRTALTIQDAVIRGDLAEARPMAGALAMEPVPPALPDRSIPHIDAMRNAARRIADSTTLDAAAEGTANLLATCGSCHVSSGVRPALIAPPSSAKGGVVGHMRGHQQAVELMLEGLVGPSTTSWQDGARALKAAPMRQRDLPADPKLTRTIVAAETHLRRLANNAVLAKDPAARVRTYARVLTTCSTCHRLHPDVWGPGTAPR